MNIRKFFEYTIFETENYVLSLADIFTVVIFILATWIILKLINKFIKRRLVSKKIDQGSIYAVFQIIKYIIWIIVIGISLESIGIKFNLLIASSAALLIGLGFGLQQIFSDYVSGIIILFEGNLKINDVIQLGDGTIGKVVQIGLRTSKVETRDHYIIIVPNHKIISDDIINWSHIETKTRFHVDVGVAYGSKIKLVEKVLLESAASVPDISNKPSPFVRFDNFGNSSLDFQIFFWTYKSFRVENIKSALRFVIDEKFTENNIKIPFPQRDVHIIPAKK
ncbi:MAG: mechanosensitive ion channel [Bacteroidales bacterium]|nr:mechanosensitive ion channel [Bacteroidales bacterium]